MKYLIKKIAQEHKVTLKFDNRIKEHCYFGFTFLGFNEIVFNRKKSAKWLKSNKPYWKNRMQDYNLRYFSIFIILHEIAHSKQLIKYGYKKFLALNKELKVKTKGLNEKEYRKIHDNFIVERVADRFARRYVKRFITKK